MTSPPIKSANAKDSRIETIICSVFRYVLCKMKITNLEIFFGGQKLT